MENTRWRIINSLGIVSVLVFSVLVAVTFVRLQNVGIVKEENFPSNANRVRRDARVKDQHGTYGESALAEFARRNRHKLDGARARRKKECGSLVEISPIDCDICVLLVHQLLAMIKKGSTQEEVVEFATAACIDLRIEDERVCVTVVQEFKDEIVGVLIRLGYKPEEVCAMALGPQCGTPWDPLLMWNVTFPDKSKPPVAPPKPPKDHIRQQ